jgi:hypothetical protein
VWQPIAARHAGEPFGVGQLRRKIGGLAQSEIGGRGLVHRDRDRRAIGEFVTGRPDAQGILPRLKSGRRETVAAVLVADDGYGDGRSRFFGADQNAFESALPVRNLARQRRARLRKDMACARKQCGDYNESDACDHRTTRHGHLP